MMDCLLSGELDGPNEGLHIDGPFHDGKYDSVKTFNAYKKEESNLLILDL
jgi:hypothetical protein